MVEIYNDVSTIEELISKHDKIFLYGAGASCKLLLESFWNEVLKGHVTCIIDANEKLNNTSIRIGDDEINIKNWDNYCNENNCLESNPVFLLTPVFSAPIVNSLDNNDKFDGTIVYLWPMICLNQYPDDFTLKSESTPLIPRKIHYFWIGGKPIPDEYKRNIDGWRELNPDYEICLWNEENFDFSVIPYTREAYQSGSKYLMYVTDYARMDVLYRHGGIYLDTDVELLKPLDDLLYNRAFIGIEENSQLNSGSALGAIPRHPMIRNLMKCYEDEHFLDESGNPKRNYNTYFETKCFIGNGYKLVNHYQKICDVVCFPRELFMPICFAGMEDCYTNRTVSVHNINSERHAINKAAYEKWKDRIR